MLLYFVWSSDNNGSLHSFLRSSSSMNAVPEFTLNFKLWNFPRNQRWKPICVSCWRLPRHMSSDTHTAPSHHQSHWCAQYFPMCLTDSASWRKWLGGCREHAPHLVLTPRTHLHLCSFCFPRLSLLLVLTVCLSLSSARRSVAYRSSWCLLGPHRSRLSVKLDELGVLSMQVLKYWPKDQISSN